MTANEMTPPPPVVLVVDDSPENLAVVGDLLAPEYRVRVANSGYRALEMARQEPRPDLVLLDIMMPAMDGHEVLTRLKRDAATCDIPVIFLTAMDSEENEERGLAEGAVDYLAKPVQPAILLARVKAHMELHRSRRELKAYNESLEWRVAERTRELEVAKLAAEAGSRAKSDFIARISHELRTPMNGIIGMLTLLKDMGLSADQLDMLNIVDDCSHALMAVLADIIDYSAAEGAPQVRKRGFAVAELLAEMRQLYAPQASAKALAFAVAMSPEVPASVVGDPTLLRQVLIRLIDNALKFTAQGRVDVEVAAQPLVGHGIELRFAVRDTGCGVPPGDDAGLFQPFTQCADINTRQYGGLGLGLAIAERLVSSLQGRIGFIRRPEGGSIFWFELPCELPA